MSPNLERRADLQLTIVIEADAWSQDMVEKIAAQVAALLPEFVDIQGEATALFTNDAQMQSFNNQFRQRDKPTNVLSFPAGTGMPGYIGDIALGHETVAREAEEQGKPLSAHVAHMLVHGVLHLAGYDHELDAEAEVMERLEVDILAAMAIENPYEEPLNSG